MGNVLLLLLDVGCGRRLRGIKVAWHELVLLARGCEIEYDSRAQISNSESGDEGRVQQQAKRITRREVLTSRPRRQ